MYEVVLPKLGVSIEEGTIVHWFKNLGDQVVKGEPLFSVETEKATVDVEADVSGTIAKIIHQKGETLAAGEVVALISLEGEEASAEALSSATRKIIDAGSKSDAQKIKTGVGALDDLKDSKERVAETWSTTTPSSSEIRASPSARRLMRQHSIDPKSLASFTRGETITAEDVERFLKVNFADFKITSAIELSGRRLTIAKRLGQSEAVPVTLFTEADATSLNLWRNGTLVEGSKPSLTAAIIPVVAQALKTSPEFNGVFEDSTIKIVENINIGIAVDSKDGLIVPVIKNADKLSLPEISKALRVFEEKVKLGGLSAEDLSKGTFTITNLGMFGVTHFTPVINPPQFVILGVGALSDRLSAKILPLSLTIDHRILDGASGARFLRLLKEKIESSFVKS